MRAIAVALVVSGVASAAEPEARVGDPISMEGLRVTLLSVSELTRGERQTPHGVSGGGRRLVWLVEPSESPPSQPVIGDVRLTANGAVYNPVTNATSSKPFAPDIGVYDVATYAKKFPSHMGAKKLLPRARSLVLEVIIRGAKLEAKALETAQLQLGILPPGVSPSAGVTPRYVWFSANLKHP
ncbi:hypothetical protein LZ198_13880 [Myxococcus sp. K15C18031901]|uniref:hypothetical protein n=1 Tax=Myxococcus dinghuensis TaxID=2906761 RepID=UPI0020A71785|nr:hypothetical protein [Myxococcus dinghuensis]MCP3099960.1 hypothetical protein [Myxococcus dinghuensis]